MNLSLGSGHTPLARALRDYTFAYKPLQERGKNESGGK
ncbi:MAG: hypothetical protein RI953_2889 [Pseudomonadota bacterium]